MSKLSPFFYIFETVPFFLTLCLITTGLLCSDPALAEDFSTTNIQLLYGNNFHDRFLDNNTTDGRMTTVTLEHFGTWD